MSPDDSCNPPAAPPRRRAVFFEFVSHYGGGQQATVATCAALRRHYDVQVIDPYGVCEPYVGALADLNIPHHVLQPHTRDVVIGSRGAPLRRALKALRQIPAFWQLTRALRRTLRDVQPDVLWSNSTKALTFLRAAGVPRQIPVGFYAHGWYRREQVPALRRRVIRRFADFYLAVSNETARQMASWGVTRERIYSVYNTMNIDEVATKAAGGLNAPLPGMDRPVRLVCPGVLLRTKGHHTAVAAARLLHTRGVDATLWIVGDIGKGNTEDYLNGMRQAVRDADLEDHVHFLGWRTDLAAIMATATALVFPSHTEGLPRVVIEAMLLRCPAVVTPVGGIPDLVKDGQTGLLAAVDDATGFADAIQRVHADDALRERITTQAEVHARALMNEQSQIGLICNAFEAEIARRAPGLTSGA